MLASLLTFAFPVLTEKRIAVKRNAHECVAARVDYSLRRVKTQMHVPQKVLV